MNKKDRKKLLEVINGLVIIIGLAIVFNLGLSYYFYIVVILGSPLFSYKIIGRIITVKSIKKKPAQKKQQKTTSKTNTKTGNPYNMMSYNELLTAKLDDMNGYDFEELCYQYFNHNVKYVEQTSYGKDKGVDFIFKDEDGFRVAVQVKHRYSSRNNVTVKEINELNGAKRNHRCTKAMFITSAGYTKDAINLADDLHIETHAEEWVNHNVLKWQQKEAKKRKLIS